MWLPTKGDMSFRRLLVESFALRFVNYIAEGVLRLGGLGEGEDWWLWSEVENSGGDRGSDEVAGFVWPMRLPLQPERLGRWNTNTVY